MDGGAQDELRRKLEEFKRRKEAEKQRAKAEKQRDVAAPKGGLIPNGPKAPISAAPHKVGREVDVGSKSDAAPPKPAPKPILKNAAPVIAANKPASAAAKAGVKPSTVPVVSNNIPRATTVTAKPSSAPAQKIGPKTQTFKVMSHEPTQKGKLYAPAAEKDSFPVNFVNNTQPKKLKADFAMVTDPNPSVSRSCQTSPLPEAQFDMKEAFLTFLEQCSGRITEQSEKTKLAMFAQFGMNLLKQMTVEKQLEHVQTDQEHRRMTGRHSNGLGPAARVSSTHSTPILQPGSYNPMHRAQFTPADDEDDDIECTLAPETMEGDEDDEPEPILAPETMDDDEDDEFEENPPTQTMEEDYDMGEMSPPTSTFLEDDRYSTFDKQRPSGDGDDDESVDEDDNENVGDRFDSCDAQSPKVVHEDEEAAEDDEESSAFVSFPPRRFGKLKGTPHPTRRGRDVQGIVSMLDKLQIGTPEATSAPEDVGSAAKLASNVAIRKNGQIEVICGPVEKETGSVTVLTPRKANKLEREALGVDSVVTNARRSLRLFKQDIVSSLASDHKAGHELSAPMASGVKVLQEIPLYQNGFLASMEPFEREKVAQLLAQADHTYAPNKELLKIKNDSVSSVLGGSPRKYATIGGAHSVSATPKASRRQSIFDNDRTPKAH